MINNVRISNIAKLVGNTVKAYEGTRLYISTGDIDNEENETYVSFFSKPSRANLEVKENNILVAKMKDTVKTTLINKTDEDSIYSTGFFAIASDVLKTKYLYYLLLCDEFEQEKNSWSFGTTQVTLNADKYKFIRVQYENDTNIQSRIASYLDKKIDIINQQIAKNKKAIDLLSEYRANVISQIVTKGLDNTVKYKDSGSQFLGQVPSHWVLTKLRFLGKFQNGVSASGDRFESGLPFVNYTDVYNNFALPQSFDGVFDSNERERELYSINRGDVLFTRTSETIEEIGLSSVCFSDVSNATFSGFLIRFRPYKEELLPQFSKYYFRSNLHRDYFAREMNMVSRASLSQDLLKSLTVVIPPTDEQREIADYLDKQCGRIDKIIEYRKGIIDKLEEYKKSLIYECVTGRKEVL
ncbi:MAG: restriction endonuclease subunit S [Firmicutes bacterium]|nr:restriction endonuclease subunit S [Bacillota bacterium]